LTYINPHFGAAGQSECALVFDAQRLCSQAYFLQENNEKRLHFIDALRVAAIVFVIIHHAAQAYGPTGGVWPVHDHAQKPARLFQ